MLNKDITFFIWKIADQHMYAPIIKEAENRGYTTHVTYNEHEKCEIGVYCQHVNYPENSKFSVIMLHDLIQGYPRWPDIWENEPWDKYDIGILPAKFWVNMWKNASYKPWTKPRLGVYEGAWIKADITVTGKFKDEVKRLSEELKLDKSKKTVLYAPSWENDNKQDDFIKAMLQLDVNILIKHGFIDKEKKQLTELWSLYEEIYDSIEKMNELHKDIPNVRILDPKLNIFNAMFLADLLVSEESSTMAEMVLMGKPVIAVEDWLIPDTIPRRTACKGHAFTIKATRATLKDVASDVLQNYDMYQEQAIKFRDGNFLPVGNNAKRIVDIIDAAVNGNKIPYEPITSPFQLPPMNLQYYNNNDKYSDGDVEDRILKYICNNEPEQYSHVFENDSEWAVFYHLTHYRKNLLNWYNFKPGSSLLEIGAGMGGLTGLFCEKCEHVTAVEMSKRRAAAIQTRCKNYKNLEIIVGDFTAMEFDRKYDYITVIGVLEYQSVYGSGKTPQLDFLSSLKKLLAPGGKLIVAIENKYGLKYWTGEGDDHSGIPFGSINDFVYGGEAKTFDREELSSLLTEAGLKKQKFYYPLPDYKLPRLIYTDDYINEDLYYEAFPLYYSRDRFGNPPVVIDEKKVRGSIIRNNVFPFFANSFMVECSLDSADFDDTLFASIQGFRKEQYRICTRFDGNHYYKTAVCPEANEHIQNCYKNIIDLKNHGIPVVPTEYKQNYISSPTIISGEIASKRFINLFKKDDLNGAKVMLDILYDYILKSSEKTESQDNYLLKTGILSKTSEIDFGVILKNAYCDLILQNCFCNENNEYVFFDQEWMFHNLPASYIFFRNLIVIYFNNTYLEDMCPIEHWKTQYNLTLVWDIYIKLDEYLFSNTPWCIDFKILSSLSYIQPDVISNNIKSLQTGSYLSLVEERIQNKKDKDHLIAENKALFKIRDILTAQLYEVISERDTLINSRSWRITKPLRSMAAFIRGHKTLYIFAKGLLYLKRNGIIMTVKKIYKYINKNKNKNMDDFFTITKNNRKLQENTKFTKKIKISIITPLYNTPEKYLIEMIESVQSQTYKNWELCLTDGSEENYDYVEKICIRYSNKDNRIKYKKLEKNEGISENSNRAIEMSTGEYIGLLDHDDLLHPSTLYEVMNVICEKNADFIYTDETSFNDNKKTITIHYKPDYAIDNLRGCHYIAHLTVFKKEYLNIIGKFRSECDGSQDHDLTLRLMTIAKNVYHIPKILYFWRAHANSVASDVNEAKPYAVQAGIKSVYDSIRNNGIPGTVESAWVCPTFYRIKYELFGNPLVSIIIPNKDNINILKTCINSILSKTTYSNYEIIIAENNSIENETFEYYNMLERENLNIKVVYWNEKRFNYSDINNYAVKYTNGTQLIFLNNDIEIITPDWIQEMLMYSQRKDVGAVGAKLYYPDDTIQHAGVIFSYDNDEPFHVFAGLPRDAVGYMGKLWISQNFSAVTGACMMVRKDVFEQVGAFSNEFQNSFCDIDLCLKIRQACYLIAWTPYCEAYHYESKTRGYMITKEKQVFFEKEINLLKEKWKSFLDARDPYYNPNL